MQQRCHFCPEPPNPENSTVRPNVLSEIKILISLFLFLQDGFFEGIADGLRKAKVMVACVSDEVSLDSYLSETFI